MLFLCTTRWTHETEKEGGKAAYFDRRHKVEAVDVVEAGAIEQLHNMNRGAEGMHAEGWHWEIVSIEEVKS